MRTSELIDIALDWAVAKCEGHRACWEHDFKILCHKSYHLKWEHGGPIIEREKIAIVPLLECWEAAYENAVAPDYNYVAYHGPTPLVAAMRCYVASKLGDEVEIPEELK